MKTLPSPRKGKGTTPSTPIAPKRVAVGRTNTLHFAPPAPAPAVKAEKPNREKKPKRQNDPKLVAAARELRDRWLEHVNAGGAGEMLIEGAGKYDVTRQRHLSATATLLLPAA